MCRRILISGKNSAVHWHVSPAYINFDRFTIRAELVRALEILKTLGKLKSSKVLGFKGNHVSRNFQFQRETILRAFLTN